jgi:hypothetical protein
MADVTSLVKVKFNVSMKECDIVNFCLFIAEAVLGAKAHEHSFL